MGVSRSILLVVAIVGSCIFSSAGAQSGTFAVVEAVQGEVRSGGAPIFRGQRISPGARITTALGGEVALRFDDGMRVVLSDQTIFRPLEASASQVTFDLLSGGARVRTGAAVRSNPKQFSFRTTQATLGVEGPADFTVVVTDGAYVRVTEGTVVAVNATGSSRIAAGSTVQIRNSGTAPSAVAPAQLPASVATSFQVMELLPADALAAPVPAAPTPGTTPAAPEPVAAAAPARMYVGFSVGQAKFDDGMTSGLITSGTTDTEASGFKVFGGYMFHPNFGVEVGYADLGEATYSGSFNGTPVSGGKLQVSGFDAALIARAHVGERLTVFAKAGVFAWEAEANDTAAGVAFSSKTDGADALFGVGAAYSITRAAGVRLEAESRKVGDDSVTLFSIGLEFRF